MKKFLVPALGLVLASFSLHSAVHAEDAPPLEVAKILVSTPEIDFSTTIEAAYPRVMATDEQLGKPLAEPPVKITPAWKGTWSWVSPRVAGFRPAEAPKLGTSYTFSLRSGQKDIVGDRVPLGGETTTRVARLGIVTQGTPVPPDGQAIARRQNPTLLLFNGPVATDSLKANLAYRDNAGRVQQAAWRLARWSEMSTEARGHLTLGERILRGTPSLSEDEIPERPLDAAIPWAVVAWPAEPLPAGEEWKLIIGSGVAAADGSKSKLGTQAELPWGTILPGLVQSISTDSPVDAPGSIDILFDKRMDEAADIWKYVTITPAPQTQPEVNVYGTTISLASPDFAFGIEYKVEVKPGLPAEDGLPLAEGKTEEKLVFTPAPPAIALPSTTEIQLAGGRQSYPIVHVNVRDLHIRVKEIPADDLPRMMAAYTNYTSGMGDSGEGGRRYGFPVAFELAPGRVLHDETVTLDPEPKVNQSGTYTLDWKKILAASRPAALFVSIEGKRAIGQDSEYRLALSQALVQISDIGLAWKCGDDDVLVYAFSHTTAKPVGAADLVLQNADGTVSLSTRTDDQGMARFARPAKPTTLVVKRGSDIHAVEFDAESSNYSPWGLGANFYDWSEPQTDRRAACMFTDRSLYRPGELVHLAGIVRGFKGSLPMLPADRTIKVAFCDDDGRAFLERDLPLSAHGHFTLDAPLPAEKVGFFHARVTLPALKKDGSPRTFQHYFQVQEFRRNTFELSMPAPETLTAPAEIKLPLTGTYFLGAPVAKGDVRWTAHFLGKGFYPDKWRDYVFADHREFDGGYWSYYYGLDYYYSPERSTSYQNGEATLDAAGALELAIPVPADQDFPAPRRAAITAEVTDANQQTLSVQKEITLHPASFYLGLRRPPELVRAGDTLALDTIAVQPDGAPAPNATQAVLRVEKQVWNTVEVRAAGGGMVKRNEAHMEAVSEQPVAMPGGQGSFSLALPETGVYHVTLEAKDEAARPVRTTVAINVVGKDYYAWEGMEGVRVDLLPDKKLYQPGDTARLLVKTPIEGTALVTVEREGIERAFVTRLTGSAPVIEVPLTDIDAPNTHVGVMIISGAAESHLKFPEPRAKFGYARLTVEQRLPKLQVAVTPTRPSVRPGADATVEVKVADHAGNPVSNAAIVLYAVDEGVLSVMGYDNPDAMSIFHGPRPMRVRTSATFPNLLAEDPEALDHYNKGYVIGGGGEGMANMPPRVDFNPCAFWSAKLPTSATGTASATFKTPDTLTRYRLIAVAIGADGWKFGTGTGALEVTKPLMVEPSPPRFAHVGDVLNTRALVVNRSPVAGVFSVALQTDSLATLESAPRAEVALQAGESKAVEFTVRFTAPGKTTWNWQATPVRFDGNLPPELEGEMTDATRGSFEVIHPIPVLREMFSARLTPEAKEAALLDNASPNLRAGTGQVVVTIANTRLADGLGAVQGLLHYPYGCVEQTSSSMMPWLTLNKLRDLLPDMPGEEEVKAAVATGVARLASMRTSSGGLAYWPGADQPSLWGSVHAAHVLVLARQAGHEVPDSLLDPLIGYLANALPGMMEDKDYYDQAERVRALYILALAGKPDAAYMNRLFDTRATLREESLINLALAFAATKDGQAKARELLAITPATHEWSWWYPANGMLSLRLQATVAAGLDRAIADKILDELLASRARDGSWGSTYTNAAGLHALGAYHAAFEKNFGAAKVVVSWEGNEKEITLDGKPARVSLAIGLGEIPPQSRPAVRLADGSAPAYVTTEILSRPTEFPVKRLSPVFGIERQYQRVQPDGTLADAAQFNVGDLVAVTLKLRATEGRRYLAIDDPLPSTLEAVNPDFKSQAGSEAAMDNVQTWASDHTELRDDRALFFCNHLYNAGEYTITYLARVTKAGTVFAPPTKVEAMYDPSLTAITEGSMLKTLP